MKKSVLVILFIIFFGDNSFSEIYKYTDENGVLHFTDSPTAREFELYIKKEETGKTRYPSHIYDELILDASIIHNIPFSVIKAIIKVESNFNSMAVSHKGARGLMQLMPVNIKNLKIKDPFDPYQNIMGGTKYFRKLLERFDGDLKISIAAYNAGPSVVARYRDIPPFPETRNFVKKVIKYNYKYRYN
jgi:soluble lytic murein transglycosylase